MRSELRHIERIEQFLANKLPKKEQEAMQKQLQQDSQLRAEVDFQAQLVSQLKENAFLEDIKNYHNTHIKNFPPIKNKRHWWVLALTLGAFAVLILAWFNRPPVEGNLQQIQLNEDEYQAIQTEGMTTLDPSQFEVPFQQETIRNERGTTIVLNNTGSSLHIPPKAVLLPNGQPVEGEYTVRYRKYSTAAQMAFSGITMHHKQERFNSFGMLEIRAIQNGQILQINPQEPITLDFELLQRQDDLLLYHFNEKDSIWNSLGSIDLPPLKRIPTKKELADIAYNKKIEKILKAQAKADSINGIVSTPTTRSPLDTATYTMGGKVHIGDIAIKRIADKEEKPTVDSVMVNQVLLKRRKIVQHKHNPKLIKGLQLPSFGVYNCGQKYTVAHQILVEASYTTFQKNAIQNGHTLSVIDLDYNAAYSFEPNRFLCNRVAANVFLLWTTDGKLYSFYKSARQTMGDKSFGTFAFAMDDLTNKIQSTEELQQYLDNRKQHLVN
jgi:hypothetical protein